MTISYKRALIVGGSSGVGRGLALALAGQGVETRVVARGQKALDALREEAPAIVTEAADASASGFAERVLSEYCPDLVILAGGHRPPMGALRDSNWEDFSSTWNADTKFTYEFTKAVLQLPLERGSLVANISSGASLGGSRLSGGYAGAKRMQTFLALYGQQEADELELGIRFISIIPQQLMEGSAIGLAAASAYAAVAGITREAFMSRWERPLTPALASEYLIDFLDNPIAEDNHLYGLKGTGIATLD